jgi:hypothetical protein
MSKQQKYHIIEWGVAIAACGWLVWKMATYDDYAGLWAALQGMGWMEWGALVLCVALMPVNMGIEAWRWKTLWNDGMMECWNDGISGLTFREAERQVYYSKLAGLVTPWRLGEYPARGVLLVESLKFKVLSPEGHDYLTKSNFESEKSIWARVLSMGVVGSATMTMAIVLAGLVGIAFSPNVLELLGGSYLYVLGAVVLGTVVFGGLGWYYGRRTLALTVGSPSVDRRSFVYLLVKSVGQSFVRLACWCVQLALVLYALGAVTGYGLQVTGLLCFVYYLLVTVTPNVPIAEAGVRGAWAIVVFGTMNAALAGVLLWGINTIFPCLIWFFLKKKR